MKYLAIFALAVISCVCVYLYDRRAICHGVTVYDLSHPNPGDPLASYFNKENLAIDWRFRASVLEAIEPLPHAKTAIILDIKNNNVYWNGWILKGKLRDNDERISKEEFVRRANEKFGQVACIRGE